MKMKSREEHFGYYCPQALSEFKIEYLDTARRRGVLGHMGPPAEIQPNYAAPLFVVLHPRAFDGAKRMRSGTTSHV